MYIHMHIYIYIYYICVGMSELYVYMSVVHLCKYDIVFLCVCNVPLEFSQIDDPH